VANIDLDGGLIEARAIRFLSPDQRIVRRTALGGSWIWSARSSCSKSERQTISRNSPLAWTQFHA
jgi:hypothetical protein